MESSRYFWNASVKRDFILMCSFFQRLLTVVKSLCDWNSLRPAILEALGGQMQSEAKLEVEASWSHFRRRVGDGVAASGVREVRRCLLGESVGVFCGFQLKYLDSCSPIGRCLR